MIRTFLRLVFRGPDGWRAGWRFLLFFVIAFVVVKAAYWCVVRATGYQEREGWSALGLLVDAGLTVVSAVIASAVMARLEHRTLSDYGLSTVSLFRNFGNGVLWGLVASTVVLLLLVVVGAARIDGFAGDGSALAGPMARWALVMLLLGLAEELLYRAYPLFTFTRGLGFWPAAIVLSALFGAAHLSKPHETPLDILNVALFGLFCSFTVRRTGSVWFAAGFHAMSDFADLVLYAAPNTGIGGRPLPGHLLNVTYRGPAWLTGGVCGMEASVFSLLTVLALFALVHRLYPEVRWRPGLPGAHD